MPTKIDSELGTGAVKSFSDHLGGIKTGPAASFAMARQLWVCRESVRRGVRQAEVNAGGRPGRPVRTWRRSGRLWPGFATWRRTTRSRRSRDAFFVRQLAPRNR